MCYRIISSQNVKLGRFTITMDKVSYNNQEYPYSYVKIRESVCVLPFLEDNIVLLYQYRHSINAWELEIPGGMIDANEKPAEAAERELLEETGYKVQELFDLGYYFPSPGSTTEKVYLFAAKCFSSRLNTHLDALELIRIQSCPIKQFEYYIKNNRFRHGMGLVAWSKYKMLF